MTEDENENEVKELREALKAMLPIAENVFDSITIDDGETHRKYIAVKSAIAQARKLIELNKPEK